MSKPEERPPATAEDLEEILRTLQRRLGLDHWEITLDLEGPLEEANSIAEVESEAAYEVAIVRLMPEWRETSADRWGRFGIPVELVLAHELAHLVLRPIDRAFYTAAGRLGHDAEALARESYRMALELVVDRVARVVVEAA